jgi:hypothetical protein
MAGEDTVDLELISAPISNLDAWILIAEHEAKKNVEHFRSWGKFTRAISSARTFLRNARMDLRDNDPDMAVFSVEHSLGILLAAAHVHLNQALSLHGWGLIVRRRASEIPAVALAVKFQKYAMVIDRLLAQSKDYYVGGDLDLAETNLTDGIAMLVAISAAQLPRPKLGLVGFLKQVETVLYQSN